MHLTLSPQRGLPGQPETTVHVAGEILTIDGQAVDLSVVPEGGQATAPDDSLFIGPITRLSGVLHAMLIVRLGDTAAPDQDGPWVIENPSGDVVIPAHRLPEPVMEDDA